MELGFNAIRYNFSYSGRFFGYSFLHPFKTNAKKKNLASISINKVEDTVNLQIIIRTELVFALQVQPFVRSGLIYPNNSTGTLKLAGANGAWWSSRGSSASANGAVISSAYYLEFTNSAVWSSGGPWERHYGRPLRCLSTVLGM